MKRKWLFLATCFLCCFTLLKAQQTITPSDVGSRVHFMIKNFGIKTGGNFSGLKGTIKFDPNNLSACVFDVTVNAATVDTDNGSRDGHLKKEDYFDVAKYPTIRITSSKVQATTRPGRYIFTGDITIKGTTKSIKFSFTVAAKDGGYLFTSDDFEINRRDFKVGSNSMSLADDLKVSLSVLAK